MRSLQVYMNEYQKQMQKGDVQKAYRGLMDFIMGLRTHLMNRYPRYVVSGIYYGYMDMTYFSCTPQALRDKKLKIAIVFVHEKMRFEVWLAANNKRMQKQYRQILQNNLPSIYVLSPEGKGVDSIVEATLVDNPDFDNPDALTDRIEHGVLAFAEKIQNAMIIQEHAPV